jgi:hypothetical protein
MDYQMAKELTLLIEDVKNLHTRLLIVEKQLKK